MLTTVPSTTGNRPSACYQVPEAWMNRMERMMERVLEEASLRGSSSESISPLLSTRSPTAASVEAGNREDGVGHVDEMAPGVSELLLGSIGTSLLVVTGLNIHDHVIFRDPVEEGVLSIEGWHGAYELFLDRLSLLLPYTRLSVPEEPVDDPFLRSCILSCVFAGRPGSETDTSTIRRNQAIVRYNLGRLDASNPSPAIVLGLILLSLQPLNPTAARLERHPDGYDYVGRAVSIAQAFGLPDAPWRAHRQGTESLMDGASGLLLSRCLLWHILAHRSAWVDIFSSPSFSSRPFAVPAPSAIYHPTPTPHEPLIAHLLMEERFFGLVATVSAVLQRVRHGSHDIESLEASERAIQQFAADAELWREEMAALKLGSSSWLCLQSFYVQMLLPFKFTSDMRVLIPSPLHGPHVVDIYERIVLTFLGHARQAITHVAHSRMELAAIPAGMLTFALLPYQANALVARMHDDHRYMCSPEAQYYRQSLVTSHALAPNLIDCLDRCVPHPGWTRHDLHHKTPNQATFEDLPPSLMDELLSWIQSDYAASAP